VNTHPDVYCLRNCFHNDATECPEDECECFGEAEADENDEEKRQQQQFIDAVESLETTTFSNDIVE
jgi:hypothetical protein